MLGRSTNAEEFQAYLMVVKTKLKSRYARTKPILIYDGARAHTTLKSTALLEKLFVPLQIPAYTCEFNCKCQLSANLACLLLVAIEKVWSAAKAYF